MIVGSFEMMEYLVTMPSSLGDGVLCDGIEVHGKYLVLLLYDIFERVLKTLPCGSLGLEPWSYLCLYGYWVVDGGRDHRGALIC